MQVGFCEDQERNLALLLELMWGRTRQYTQRKGQEAEQGMMTHSWKLDYGFKALLRLGIGVWVKFNNRNFEVLSSNLGCT